MGPIYRVEAFIVPVSNRKDKNNDNIIDDIKVANKMKSVVESSKAIEWMNSVKISQENKNNYTMSEDIQIPKVDSENFSPVIRVDCFESEESGEQQKIGKENTKETVQNTEKRINIKLSTEIEENICNVPYTLLNVNQLNSEKFRERFETDEYVTMKTIPKEKVKLGKILMRTSSLMSIDERGETPEDCNDEFCCHGYKNGCTAATQQPETVTEEIFEINWMKRLEQLRAREAIIKNKEAILFYRDRLLFKKERELRILERLIKDKLKYIELYENRCRSKNNEVIDCDTESKIPEQSKNSRSSKDNGLVERLSSLDYIESCNRIQNDEKMSSVSTLREVSRVTSTNEKILKNPSNSRSSLVTTESTNQYQAPKSDIALSYLTNRNTFGGLSGYSSLRIKKRSKVTYDDLDSTLSADNGDSSFVVTSKKFDSEIFKRPNAFTRSCSERRNPRIITKKSSIALEDVHPIEDKLLKRMSENIFVSHDKNTKFQHYGLIDTESNQQCDANLDIENYKRHSYLDLEDGKRSKKNLSRSSNKKINGKERPISWNEEGNEWLQKKRQAYNSQMAEKKLSEDIYDDKENHNSQWKLSQAPRKVLKGMKFNIFR